MMLIGNIFFINSVARDVPKRNADPYGITIFNIKLETVSKILYNRN